MRWVAYIIIFFVFGPLIFAALGSGLGLALVFLPLLVTALFIPIPLRDTGTVRYRSIPWMTLTLIFVNVILFLFWQDFMRLFINLFFGVGSDADAYQSFYKFNEHVWTYGTRSIYFRGEAGIGAFTTFTSMFMHGDHLHILGNMLFLWAFGRRLEDACGPWRYLAFYLLAGMIANIGSAVLTPASFYNYDIPGVGASGAIFGVLGGYLILFPGARVNCLWGLGIIPIRLLIMFGGYAFEADRYKPFRWTINIPAFLLIGYFAIINNVLPSFDIMQGEDLPNAGGTIAHVTGFLAAITIFLFVRKDLALRFMEGRRL